jgi:two-component system chemotaxis sensor kinase CheA
MLSDSDIMAQVFAAFKAEQVEHRQALGELLLDLEREPDHPNRRAILDQLFREAHSLKGGARAAGLLAVEQLAHHIEDIFAAVRQGTLVLTPELCDPIYAALDAIGALMEQAAAGSDADLTPFAPLLAALSAAASADAPVAGQLPPAPPAAPEPVVPEPAPAPRAAPEETVRLSIGVLDGLLNEAGELMTCSLRARELAREAQQLQDLPARWGRLWRRINPLLTRARGVGPALEPVVHHLDERAHAVEGRWRHTEAPLGARSLSAPGALPVREQEPLLEALEQANALVGELAASLALLSRRAAEDQTRLAAVTDRLHAQIRRTRMLPLATLVNPLRLQLREMARAAGKLAALELDDRGAEADRQVLDQLREVLMHLLRNAIDHGIEAPEARVAAGKPELGTITLRASVGGDRLTIELEDDGAGLDIAAIRGRALAAGLLGASELERADESELADLIFLPGFSTRQTVSALSGRGVGLDVVRSRVERMHGRVTVRSRPGGGTTFSVDVPLSLTSSHGLLLQVGATRCVLPLDAVQRILMPGPSQVQSLEGRPVLRVEGRPLPLVALGDLLGLPREPGAQPLSGLALILGSGDRQVACLVDAVLGEQELVVHRLPAPLIRVRFLSGATILADGRVVPILDAVDLVRAAGGAQRRPIALEQPAEECRRVPVVLVADDSITTRTLEKNILEAAGYRVCLATDGQEALDALRRLSDDGGCDLLLSDIDMPRLNGFDLTSRVRADAVLRHLPVVLVTSLDSPADRERGVACGADAYIVKRAFDQQTLLDTIARLI